MNAQFQRIQSSDLLPADLIGTLIYNPQRNEFTPKLGPIFTNLVPDEINRAPAKVQSALLESMAERQVTIGDTTYALPDPFLVLATITRSTRKAPTNFPRPNWTGSLSKWWSITPPRPRNGSSSTACPIPSRRTETQPVIGLDTVLEKPADCRPDLR
ncbi:MAG: AAA family ATPase [Verrucomicrobiales bacterium]